MTKKKHIHTQKKETKKPKKAKAILIKNNKLGELTTLFQNLLQGYGNDNCVALA